MYEFSEFIYIKIMQALFSIFIIYRVMIALYNITSRSSKMITSKNRKLLLATVNNKFSYCLLQNEYTNVYCLSVQVHISSANSLSFTNFKTL